MTIKTPISIEERNNFINETLVSRESKSILANLKSLTLDQLVDRYEAIEYQSQLMQWVIIANIREKIPSKKEFGQFIQRLYDANPKHPLCVISQSQRNRYIRAGQFVLKHKITDLNDVALKPTVVYEIVDPKNTSVADAVFKKARAKDLSVNQVRELIEVEKQLEFAEEAIEVVEEPREPVPPYVVPVVNNVAVQVNSAVDYLTEDEGYIDGEVVPPSVNITLVDIVPTNVDIVTTHVDTAIEDFKSLVNKLPSVNGLSEQQVIEITLSLLAKFTGWSEFILARVMKEVSKSLSGASYGR